MSMIDRYDIFILLMENKSGRLVVYSILYSFFLHPRWLARFQPSTNIFIGHFFFQGTARNSSIGNKYMFFMKDIP